MKLKNLFIGLGIMFAFLIAGVVATTYTINQNGVFVDNNKSFARTADVVVCRGTSLADDIVKSFQCDYTCPSTTQDCDPTFDSIDYNNKRIFINTGNYPNVSIIGGENMTIIGSGGGKSSYRLTRLLGNGDDPVIDFNIKYTADNTNLTHSVQIRDIVLVGLGSDYVFNGTNLDILRLENVNINNGKTCVNLDYSGVEPYTSASVPGGFWIMDSIFLCTDYSIIIKEQTQGWIQNNWFPSGTANSLATIWIDQSNKIRISGNEFDATNGGAGILVSDSVNNKVSDLIMTDNWHNEGASRLAYNFTNYGKNANSRRIIVRDLSVATPFDYPNNTNDDVTFDMSGGSTYRSFARGVSVITSGTNGVSISHGVRAIFPVKDGEWWVQSSTNKNVTLYISAISSSGLVINTTDLQVVPANTNVYWEVRWLP